MQAYLDAYLPVLVLLVATFSFAGVAAGSNAYQIGKNYDVSHLWETRERLAAIIPFAVLTFAREVWAGNAVVGLLSIVLGAVAGFVLFGLRFDIRLNLRRGLDRNYVGTDPNTSAQDKKVTALGLTGKQFSLLKLAGVVVLTVGLVLLRRPH